MQVFEQIKAQLQPIFAELSKPIIGPFKGWHVVILIVYIVSQFFQSSGDKIRASHILVKEEAKAKSLKLKIEKGASFEEIAREHSTCPSGKQDGDLGEFSKGQMVPEFDAVCFDPETQVGVVYGPIKTQFGYHLIKITENKKQR